MIGKKILEYEIVERIAVGGMGNIYLAVHAESGEKVAVKTLLPELKRHESERTRFMLEAQALEKLPHPNIVSYIGYVEDEESAYLIMEYIPGKDLSEYIRTESGPLPPDVAVKFAKQILSALTFAHLRNIIHRDIKPSNIVVTEDRNIKMIDFGIAKHQDYDGKLTKTGSRLGAPYYMSPEQVTGKLVDKRTDIFAIGVTLFQMITGHGPYEALTSDFEVFGKIVNEPLPPVRTLYEGARNEFDAVIAKCTAKNPADRYQNCFQLINALDEILPASKSFFHFNEFGELVETVQTTQKRVSKPIDKPQRIPLTEKPAGSPGNMAVTRRDSPFRYVLGIAVLVLVGFFGWQFFNYRSMNLDIEQGQVRSVAGDASGALIFFDRAKERMGKIFLLDAETTKSRIQSLKGEMYKKIGDSLLEVEYTDTYEENIRKATDAYGLYSDSNLSVQQKLTLCNAIIKAIDAQNKVPAPDDAGYEDKLSIANKLFEDADFYASTISVNRVVRNNLSRAKTRKVVDQEITIPQDKTDVTNQAKPGRPSIAKDTF